jgi:hypothetical protein
VADDVFERAPRAARRQVPFLNRERVQQREETAADFREEVGKQDRAATFFRGYSFFLTGGRALPFG